MPGDIRRGYYPSYANSNANEVFPAFMRKSVVLCESYSAISKTCQRFVVFSTYGLLRHQDKSDPREPHKLTEREHPTSDKKESWDYIQQDLCH